MKSQDDTKKLLLLPMRMVLMVPLAMALVVAVSGVASASLITGVVRANGQSGDRPPIGVFDGSTAPLATEPGGLMDGNLVFSDRMYPWAYTPVELIGAEYIRTFNTDKNTSETDVTYTVTISRPSTVAITVDDRILSQQEAVDAVAAFAAPGTFKDSGLTVCIHEAAPVDRPMSVFAAELPPGTYVFGPQPSGRNFYTVASASLITGVVRANGQSGNQPPIGVFDGSTAPLATEPGGLKDGNLVFSDRMFPWTGIPAELIGAEYIRTFNTDKNSGETDVTYTVTISNLSTVAITVDDRIPSQQDAVDTVVAAFAAPGTFKDTGLTVYIRESLPIDRPMTVFVAELPAGTYVFGAQPSGHNFYTIAAIPATITGYKFYDADADGEWDDGEPPIEGWMVHLTGTDALSVVVDEYAFTDTEGKFIFDELLPGTYMVEEVFAPAPPTWLPTTDTSFSHKLGRGEDYVGPDFGNVCLQTGHGGLSLGFWSNKNGQALITADDIAALNALNLYNPGWTYPPFATAGQIRTYLLSATAVDMRWMLSGQLIATKLDVLHGFLSGSTIVHVGLSTYVPSGFIPIAEIMDNANDALLLDPQLDPDCRAEQEYWKNLLDGLNNNTLRFVCPEPCLPIVYP